MCIRDRVNTEKKMAHGRVADRGCLVDFMRLDARFPDQAFDDPVERLDHFALQPLQAVRIVRGISDPRDDIGSVEDVYKRQLPQV